MRRDGRNAVFIKLNLKKGEVHIWHCDLDAPAAIIPKLLEVLSAQEKQKAEKFRSLDDRSRFIVARSGLRKILGNYLGIAPQSIGFSQNRYGKPFLADDNNRLRFNLSHSNELALIAVTIEGEIGIDLEYVNVNFEILNTAASVFSTVEMEMLRNMNLSLQTAAFFCGWTRKEAFLKALGQGFSYAPKQITVSILPEDSNVSLKTNEFQKVRSWSLRSLPVGDNYRAAIAVEGKIETVRYWRHSETRQEKRS